MRKQIEIFISYARKNQRLVKGFCDKLQDVLNPSKSYNYKLSADFLILTGEDWDDEINNSLDLCDIGLFLISPSFLSSKYITEIELPKIINSNKLCVPVMLHDVNIKLHDLKGLEKKQIFRYKHQGFNEPRSYYDCTEKRRDNFILELFSEIEHKLNKAYL